MENRLIEVLKKYGYSLDNLDEKKINQYLDEIINKNNK